MRATRAFLAMTKPNWRCGGRQKPRKAAGLLKGVSFLQASDILGDNT